MPSSSDPCRNPKADRVALAFAVLSILVFLGTALWFWIQAPDHVASHFDAAGQPDGWSSKTETLGVLVPIGIAITLAFTTRWIWEKLPTSIINIPNKHYWIEHGETSYLYDCLMQFMRIMGGSVALLFTTILVMILREGRGASMPTGMTFIPTAVFLLIAAAATWRFWRQLKP